MSNYRKYQNNGNYQNRGNGNYSQRNGGGSQEVKRSGAVYTKIRSGKNEGLYAVNAWRMTRLGMMTARAFPFHSDVEITSQKGNEFVKYTVEVSNTNSGTNQLYWCLMNKKTQKIVIDELGLVISPNGRGYTSSGKRVEGYFGKLYK